MGAEDAVGAPRFLRFDVENGARGLGFGRSNPVSILMLRFSIQSFRALSTVLLVLLQIPLLEDISIFKEGVFVETVPSNVDGDFIFPLVFGGFDYEVKVFMYGYYEKSIKISATDNNINLGDIILDQDYISAFDVTVESDVEPTITWKSPKLSSKVKLQKDLNENSFSYTLPS